jgi:hypothetical protein
MIQKKLPFILSVTIAVLFSTQTKSQLYINSATFFIQSGATVTVQGNVTSNTNIQGTGLVLLNGSSNQTIDMGGNTIPNLTINNTSNAILLSNAQIGTNLTFTAGNILLGNDSLVIGNSATVTGAGSSTGFVVTNGTGVLTKDSLGTTAFNFPVGYSLTTYLPVSISNAGTVDNISVGSIDHVYNNANSSTGTAFTKEVVDASWNISEAVLGSSNLSITASWASANELAGFNRSKSGISYYITSPASNVGLDLTNAQTGTATGSGPYSYTRTGVTSLGTFAVGFRPVLTPLLVTPKIFLQGAYNSSTLLMNASLSTLLPTTEPYSALTGFTQSGSGGGETSTSAILTNTVSPNNEIVDWIFVQLHRASDSIVVSTRAALLERNGSIVETDGVSPLSMGGNLPGTYFISIRHRNHLGVRTSGTLTLAKTTNTSYDFTIGSSQAYKGVMAPVSTTGGTVYCMWGGDANGNKIVKYTGPSNDENQLLNVTLAGNKAAIISGYLGSDLNLNGQVKYTGPNNDENVLLNTILAGNKATIITQPTF